MTQAYAAVVDGEINIRTVHDTERGAKVNGLFVLFGVMPTEAWTDDMIASVWSEACDCAYNGNGVAVAVRSVDVTLSALS